MRHLTGIAAIVAAAGLCAPVLAQDSTSTNAGDLPGDALSPWSDHCAAYVVDLVPFNSTKGHLFGIAPLIKVTKTNGTNFNNLFSSSTISSGSVQNAPYPMASYSLWENAPGAGVHPSLNTAGSAVTPAGLSTQFVVAVDEFGFTTSGNGFNGIVGAFVNYDPMDANRLYVDRRQAVVSTPDAFTGDSASIGGVSADSEGNIFYRGDNNNSTGANQLVGDNLFRTRLADRDCNSMNLVSSAATLDATDRLINAWPETLGVPNNIPARIAGGNGLSVDGNAFAATAEMFVADTGSHTNTPGHLDTTGGIGGDHRGSFGTTTHDFLGNGADYSLALLAKDAQAGGGETRILNVTSVDSAGNVVGNKGFEIPFSITDNDDGFVINYTGQGQPNNYGGATLFVGGIGHVAIGRDQAGRGLMAAMVNENGFQDDFANQIVVCRYDASTGTEEWTLAAYVDQANAFNPAVNTSKIICDTDGNTIGMITDLPDVTGGLPLGPGMSAPAIDSAGNIWFLSAVKLLDRGPKGEPDFDGALIRAIYNPDTFSYKLEMILEVGQVFAGTNSGTNYRINFLGSSTAAGGAAPGTIYSSNMAEFAWNNSDLTGIDPSDPITNGGIIFGTSITYDTNDDGRFNDPTSTFFDPGFPADEAYSVGLYVGYYQETVACPADLNNDGQLDFFDISFFLTNSVDFNGDTVFDFFDISAFLGAFGAGCP